MGKQHIDKNGAIHVRQVKTGAALAIPVHSTLQAIIDATPSDHMTFLTTQFGRSFTGRTGHLYAGLARLFRLLRNARGVDRSHSLGPVTIAGRSVAPMENPTAPPRGTHRKWGLRVGCKEHGRQRPRSVASRPQQSSPLLGLSNAYFKSLGLPSLFRSC